MCLLSVILYKQGEVSSSAEDKHEVFLYTKGVCVCIYVHTHADYKSPSRAPLIIWWILQLMPALSTIMITLKFPATRLREGGETFQSSCFGNKCSFLLVFPVPPGDVFRLSPPLIVQLNHQTLVLPFFLPVLVIDWINPKCNLVKGSGSLGLHGSAPLTCS